MNAQQFLGIVLIQSLLITRKHMKSYLLLFFMICTSVVIAQQSIPGTLMHDGVERSYLLYVPSTYDENLPTPLVFNFHGYGSNFAQQSVYGDFKTEAEADGFLIIHPEGLEDSSGIQHFNAGWGTGIDDVGFTEALIDDLSSTYNIDADRIYSTGMSNGGFMSYYLACELSERFAAVASVTGSMVVGLPDVCMPNHPMPAMQIHGTNDVVVPYDGDALFEPIEDVVDYWVSFNNTETSPSLTELPDLEPTDGSTVEHYVYAGGDNGASVEFYKVLNGAHTWPGSVIIFPGTNLDFDASAKIWEFFKRYDINGEVITSNSEALVANTTLELFPNPVATMLNIQWDQAVVSRIRVLNLLGVEVQNQATQNQNQLALDVQALPSGVFVVQAVNDQNQVVGVTKFLKR